MTKQHDFSFGGALIERLILESIDRAIDASKASPDLPIRTDKEAATVKAIVRQAAKEAVAEAAAPAATKPWYRSLGVWAGLFGMLASLGLAGIQIDFETGDFSGNFYVLWGSLGTFLTSLGGMFGRFRATQRIG